MPMFDAHGARCVVFGSPDIIVGLATTNKELGLNELLVMHGVPPEETEMRRDVGVEMAEGGVRLIFTSPESVDAIISHLTELRDELARFLVDAN